MRGAPHSGFAWLMSRIKLRISAATFGLPARRRDFRVQYQAKALRCQAMTVSGRTICRLRRQPGHHRDNKTHNSRSERWKRKRRAAFGWKTGGNQSEKTNEKRAHRDRQDLTNDRNLRVFSSDGVFGNHSQNALWR